MEILESKKILEAVLTKDVKLDKESAKRVAKAKKVFVTHYSGDPKAFIEDFIKILDANTNEEIPFLFNEAQKEATRNLMEIMGTQEELALPKARQLGITTWTNAVALHHSLFNRNANVVCMAMKTDNAQENLRRIKTMFSTMPKWVQQLVMKWDEKKHLNNQGLWSFTALIPKSENKLEVASASSEDATRGKTPTFLHWTETHFSDMANAIFTSIYPALSRRANSVVVLESTGNGSSGFYYEVCTGRRKGFRVVFLPWFLDPHYRLEGGELTEADREYMKDLMGVEEIPDHIDDDQLRWYRARSETIGKAKCQQEFPINVEQVFQATSSSFFSYKTVQKLKTKVPLRTLAFEQGYLSVRPGGKGEVYHDIKTEYEYLIGVDGSEGAIDPAAITIVDPEGQEVLFWNDKMVPNDLCHLLDTLGKQYNNAKILIEANGIGQHFLHSLMSHYLYPNVAFVDGKPGLRINANKADIFATLQSSILEDKMTFNNPLLAEEMPRVDAEKLKSPRGVGIHDDTVDACAIAAYGFRLFPPKKKFVQDYYEDYTSEVYKTSKPRRRFII